MPELLSAEQVSDALQGLAGWSGGTDRISRTVRVAADRQKDLVDEVMHAADQMNHHPQVETEGEAVTFVNWTHSAGGVTDLDLQLARRIDEIVASSG
ncbi:MAG: 4a-hydroxytetrahydrobiopterin dehydratase [Streptosporangiales bacterium]|nr:4a-hydroxytetrahydrobiopterin dehydratase [Streptosporangiales bacterium]